MYSDELYERLSLKYPKSLSCEWDNDGIMASAGPVAEVLRVLISLDATEEALTYAAENSFDTLITHHPMIFSGLKSVTPDDNVSRKVIFALMNGITVMSFHTRLDAAEGGVNDALAEVLGLRNISAFGDAEHATIGRIGEAPAQGMSVSDIYAVVKEKVSQAAECFTTDATEKCSKICVLGGAGKDFIYPAKCAGADVLVTGEASYNALLDAAENGISVITAGHYETERFVLEKLKAALEEVLPEAHIEVLHGANNKL